LIFEFRDHTVYILFDQVVQLGCKLDTGRTTSDDGALKEFCSLLGSGEWVNGLFESFTM